MALINPLMEGNGGGVVSGSASVAANVATTITTGFRPRFVAVVGVKSGAPTTVCVYDAEYSTSRVAHPAATGGNPWSEMPNTAANRINTITDNGFTFKYNNSTTVYYFAAP